MSKLITGLMNQYVVFAMDEPWREPMMKAYIKEATGRSDAIKRCIGYWQGEYEFSFICDARIFEKLVKPFGYTDNQECLMHIIGEEQRVLFEWQNEGLMNFEGYLRHVCEHVALSHQQDSWTYDPAQDAYFIIQEN